MKKYIFIAVAGILALSACSKIDDVQNAPRQMTFTAGFGDGTTTRASLSGHSVTFDAPDHISILSAKNINTDFVTTTGGASATFIGTAVNDSKFYAVYPYTDGLTLSGDVISGVEIPTDQSAAASSACGWDPEAPIAYATTTGSTLTFHNACALLKIKNNFGSVQDISINVTEESLTGIYDLNTSTGALTVQDGEGAPRVVAESIPGNKTIFLAIAPGTYTDFDAVCDGGNYRRNYKASVTFQAGKIYDLGNTADWDY